MLSWEVSTCDDLQDGSRVALPCASKHGHSQHYLQIDVGHRVSSAPAKLGLFQHFGFLIYGTRASAHAELALPILARHRASSTSVTTGHLYDATAGHFLSSGVRNARHR